jgi:hypothetical protein
VSRALKLDGPLAQEAVLSAFVAGSIAALLLWFGPQGTDFAAHAYQRTLFLDHGFVLWNNFWYAGRYSFITYSVLYYPVAALLGIKVLAVASVAAAALAFAVLVGREWGPAGRLSSRTFAVLWTGIVLSATFPFALGAALALLALCSLQRRRDWRFAALALLTLAASPLAFVLLAVVVAGIAVARRDAARRALPTGVMATACLLQLVLVRLFPGEGTYPYHLVTFAAVGVFCAYGFVLAQGVERARLLQWIFVAYFAASVVSFVVPSPLGANIERLRYVALPMALLLASLRGWRPRWLVLPAIVLTISWNVMPLAKSVANAASDPAASEAYWTAAVAFLRTNLSLDYRVEVVDTARHWPAEYLPEAGIPLVRGWYRQDDFPENAILYREHVSPRAYRKWLGAMAVRYVVLTDAPTDSSARAEATLLRGGRSGLRSAYRSQHVTIFEVPHATPLVTGPAPARVVELKPTGAVVAVSAAGTYRIAIRYSPYWSAAHECVSRGGDGMLRITARRAGNVDLDFAVGVRRGVQVLTGLGPRRQCSE